MKLLSQIQFSINGIFDLYITQGRRFYGFSILFAILSSIWSIIIGGIVLYIYFTIAYTMGETRFDASQILFDSGNGAESLRYTSVFIMILNLSLYALALNQFKRSTSTRISFGTFFRCIPSSTWLTYFMFAVGGVLFICLLCDSLTPSSQINGSSLERMTRLFSGSSLDEVFISLVALLLQFSPVVLGFFLIHLTFKRNGTGLKKKEILHTLLTTVILAFVLFICASKLVEFVNDYIIRLISIPFQEMLIPSILSIMIYISLFGVFYLGLAGSYLLPFLFHEDNADQKRDMILNENSPIDEL
ncbi:MAG: hypothetical protein V4604_05740 [Bacteroidota bacterium]